MLINKDGTKLSKRQNDTTIKAYRQKGIYPEALLNFVISCGGGFVQNKETNNVYIKPLPELISKVGMKYSVKVKKYFNCNFYIV